MRSLLAPLAERKVGEEMAWTDHAAVMEEGIAGRDDLRTALGQAYLVRRCAELAAEVHRRFALVVDSESRITRRAGVLLHGLLAGMIVPGIALAIGGRLSTASLVTLFLVTSMFVGQIAEVANHVPELQAGLGAVIRLRQLLAVEPEPLGGRALPPGTPTIEFRHLTFAYADGPFSLRDVDLVVPAGATCALVGRSGSGKTTLASLVSRAVEPPPGAVFLDGVDVCDLDLELLRGDVGVVTQRTEILAGTLAQNIALFRDVPIEVVEAAAVELDLTEWIAGLPDGLDTLLGPGGTSLSAGEEQLVAFARLLVRDVRVVVLDEATARMDPGTEATVVAAADRLLTGRTGLVIAHRLSTTARATTVAVLSDGRVVQHGPREELASRPGPFRSLLDAAAVDGEPDHPDGPVAGPVGSVRRTGAVPPPPGLEPTPSLARATLSALLVQPRWGLAAMGLFLGHSLTGAYGAGTGWLWGHVVEGLDAGGQPWLLTALLVLSLLASPVLLAVAIRLYPRWWVDVLLRARTSVLIGQTGQRRLIRTPAGEAVARAMDADRLARYADRWVDFTNGLIIVAVTAVFAGTPLAGAVLLAVMGVSAVTSTVGRPLAGRSAAAASASRARFGRALVSGLESIRTVKLAAATAAIHQHLGEVDRDRVRAEVREHRVQAVLDGVPSILVQAGVVASWGVLVVGGWDLAATLLVAGAVNGFSWFGRVAGAVVTEAPGTNAWMRVTSQLAGGGDLMHLPSGVDLVRGTAPAPERVARVPLEELRLHDLTAVHEDGTIGVRGVDLSVRRGELVLLVGQVGAGKSSLLSALAGLVDHQGEIRWNGTSIDDPQGFLRPGQVAHVAQVPRVLSGTFTDNVLLDHPQREADGAMFDASLAPDIEAAGGPHALVGHRGLRLSGGQVQRLALARALATDAELVLADDVSSALDAATELELWSSLRRRGTTVIGATSKRAALAQADRVVVLARGEVEAIGRWKELAGSYGYLAG